MLKLDPEQRRVVEHGEGPLLVIAGPGSGKTRVITQRIAYLLENVPGLGPGNILALTFTDKAASEMKGRVQEALGDPQLPFISTFHAFCYHVLRRHHFQRRLLDQIDVWIFLRQRMEQLGLEFYQKLAEPGAFLHDLNEFFSRCQDDLVEPGDFEAYVLKIEQRADLDGTLEQEEINKKRELARVFHRSRELLQEAGCSSLGSLISETVRLWDREAKALEPYRAQFRFVLVDEFQDTNYAQVELLRRLIAPPYNITAVGDDDQAIYRFRGASHGAFRMFDQVFPGHQTVDLEHNYRSTKKILRAADVLIARNDRYEEKKALKTENPEGLNVYLLEAPDYVSEAAWVAGEVEHLAASGKRVGGIAVLYRSHNYRDPLVEQFRRRNIPFSIRGLSILSSTIVRDLLAYLNLVHSPHHNISLTRVLLAPRWQFPEELAFDIRKLAAKDRCSLFDTLEGTERLNPELLSTGWPELRKLLLALQAAARNISVTSLLDLLMARLGLIFLPGSREQVYVNAFRQFLKDWEAKSETGKLQEFMEYFTYFREAGGQIEAPEPPDPSNAVQMMTVHSAKGLEFPVVFVLSVARQRFPHREETPVIAFPDELRKGPLAPPDIHVQEERRLFYVAMTRARERLYVSSVAIRGRRSLFVEDLLSDPVVAARDIERIQVPEKPRAGEGIPTLPGRAALLGDSEARPRSECLEDERGQLSLFGDGPDAGTLGPNLKEWASQLPAHSPLGPDGKLQLSATAIETYRDCPLKFKFSYCLKIPTAPQATLNFGNIMHQCVRHYFSLRKEGLPRFEDIEEFYLGSWKDIGFEDSYQEQAYKKAGLEQLREFVERQRGSSIPPDQIRMEEHFQIELDDVALYGRIDQISPPAANAEAMPASLGVRNSGSGGVYQTRAFKNFESRTRKLEGTPALPAVELIDYKTGRPRSQKEADKSLQLSVYALAACRELQMDPVRLTFYNLTNNQPVSTTRTARDLEKAVGEIREVAVRIRRRRFEPTPGFACKRCEFVPICPAHEDR